MTPRGKNADASFYYYADATADVASMKSSAMYGNLADAMKDSIMVLQDTMIVEPETTIPLRKVDNLTMVAHIDFD